MRGLDSIIVSIPDFGDSHDDWVSAVEEAEDAEKPIVRLQLEMTTLLRDCKDVHDVPTVMAWLILWTRAFQSLEGLRGAITRRSLFTCRILNRALFEISLQIRVIGRPLQGLGGPMPPPLLQESVRHRLHAYLAWCFWNDLQELKSFLDPRTLKKAYDPRPARDHVRRYGPALETLSHILGATVTLTDAEADRERRDAEATARRQLDILKGYLSDERISAFAAAMDTNLPHSFFAVLQEEEATVRKVLAAEHLRFAQSIYSRGSAVLHGSTVDGVLFNAAPVYGPQVWSSDEDIMSELAGPLNWARSAFLGLWLMRPSHKASR